MATTYGVFPPTAAAVPFVLATLSPPDGTRAKERGPALRGLPRMRWIEAGLRPFLDHRPDVVVMEGPSYASSGAGSHERAGLWWRILDLLDREGLPIAIVPPSNRMTYATGKGGGTAAGKEKVLLACQRMFPALLLEDNNQADAVLMACMALHHYGEPAAQVPAAHAATIEKIGDPGWPKL